MLLREYKTLGRCVDFHFLTFPKEVIVKTYSLGGKRMDFIRLHSLTRRMVADALDWEETEKRPAWFDGAVQ